MRDVLFSQRQEYGARSNFRFLLYFRIHVIKLWRRSRELLLLLLTRRAVFFGGKRGWDALALA